MRGLIVGFGIAIAIVLPANAQHGCEETPCPYPDPAYCQSPIVLNMANGPYQLSSAGDSVAFDIDGDGKIDTLSWTAKNSPMAFLALDRNHNGVIDNGKELFGNHARLPSGIVAANGFEALAAYDSNADGLIDSRDAIWSSLLLWADLNHDGISQPNELQPIAASPITAIELHYRWVGRRDKNGNMFRYEAQIHLGSPVRMCYDIYFVSTP